MVILLGVIIGIIYGIGQANSRRKEEVSVIGIIFLNVVILLVFGMGGVYGIGMGIVICIFSDIIIIDGVQDSSSAVVRRQQKEKEYENNYGTISWEYKNR